MSVIERIQTDWKAARKVAATGPFFKRKAIVLGTLVGELEKKRKAPGRNPDAPLSEAEVLASIKALLDGVNQTITLIAGKADRVEEEVKYRTEAEVLASYIPQQMSETELEAFALQQKAVGANMGAIMAALKAAHPGEYDGKLASSVVKRVLA